MDLQGLGPALPRMADNELISVFGSASDPHQSFALGAYKVRTAYEIRVVTRFGSCRIVQF